MEFSGRVVLVTGAGSGIGRALAMAFAAGGATVAAVDRDAESLQRLAGEFDEGELSTHHCDLSDASQIDRLPSSVIAAHGRVDVLINNAGVTSVGFFEDLSETEVQRQIAVNFLAVVQMTRVFLPVLRERGQAQIVNISSEAAMVGMPYQSMYCATKAAVRGFSQALRAELSGGGVGVTVVLPGATKSRILHSAPTTNERLTGRLPDLLARHGASPERLARKIVRAVRSNKAELRFGFDSYLLDYSIRFFPWAVRFFLALLARRTRALAVRQLEGTKADG